MFRPKEEKFDTVKNPEPVTYTKEEHAAASFSEKPGIEKAAEEEKPAAAEKVAASSQAGASSQSATTSANGIASAPAAPPKARDIVAVRAGNEIRPLIPTSLDEVYRFAKMMAMTFNLPVAYYEEPKSEVVGNIEYSRIEVATMRAIHAIQLGAEVGIPPAQSIQSILVLNGIGTIWGDTQLALVLASGLCESHREYTEGEPMWTKYNMERKAESIPNPEFTWVFETKRRGKDLATTRFSIADAIHAALWGKKTWATHPDRMGKYKARAFGLRDSYPDVLKGLCHSREEMEGEMINVTAAGSKTTPINSGAEMSRLLDHKPTIPVSELFNREPATVEPEKVEAKKAEKK